MLLAATMPVASAGVLGIIRTNNTAIPINVSTGIPWYLSYRHSLSKYQVCCYRGPLSSARRKISINRQAGEDLPKSKLEVENNLDGKMISV